MISLYLRTRTKGGTLSEFLKLQEERNIELQGAATPHSEGMELSYEIAVLLLVTYSRELRSMRKYSYIIVYISSIYNS